MPKNKFSTATNEIRELLCQRCDKDYPVWYAPNELWNQVQREGEHFFCLTCFAVLAEERGIIPTAWFLRPENRADLDAVAQHADLTAQLQAALDRLAEAEGLLGAAKEIKFTDNSRVVFGTTNGQWNWNAGKGDGVYLLDRYDTALEAYKALTATTATRPVAQDGSETD